MRARKQEENNLLAAPKMTQEIMNSGVILVYGRIYSSTINEVWSLPLVLPLASQAYSYVCKPKGEIKVFCDAIDDTSAVGTPYLKEFRYIFIPSNKGARLALDFEKMPYKDVVDYFDIEY